MTIKSIKFTGRTTSKWNLFSLLKVTGFRIQIKIFYIIFDTILRDILFVYSKSYCKNNICKLNETNLHIRNNDYRKLDHFDEMVIYVNVNFNVTGIPGELRIIEDALDWSHIKIKSGNKKMCKRCLPGSNPQHQRCSTLSLEGGEVGDCHGELGLDFKSF